VLASGDRRVFTFRVTVSGFGEIVNSDYAVRSAEGEWARGLPVAVQVQSGGVFLPLIKME
jgi:hypothetical protein